ncbi:unnamed protein product, partial [Heterobilharzia americana]
MECSGVDLHTDVLICSRFKHCIDISYSLFLLSLSSRKKKTPIGFAKAFTNWRHFVSPIPENCLEEPLSPDFHQELSNLIHERYPTIRSCLLSLPFCLINLWFGLGLLRFSMYLNHLSSVLNYLFPSND